MDVRDAELAEREAAVTELIAELGTAAGRADPYPVYSRLRQVAPVARHGEAAYLTRYDDCAAIFRDRSLRSQGAAWMDTVRPGWREHAGLRATHESFVFCDPPDHTRLRHLVSGAFTQRKAQEAADHITELTGRVLDALAGQGAGGAAVDLHELLAATLPIAVVGSIIGVPEADQARLREPLEGLRLAVDGSSSVAQLAVIDASAEALIGYFAELVADRRAAPRDDLTTALAAAARPGPGAAEEPALTEDEVLQTLVLIFSAAIESMVDLLLNATAALLAAPDQARLLRADPALAPAAVEEALRFDAPVQAIARIAPAELTLGGVSVPAGTMVIAMLGAANRDPARFAAPATFDLTRTGPGALSFGGGIHRCLGAALARMEAAVFLPALLRRFPALRLAGPLERRGFVLRGFASFPVAVS